MASKPQFSSKIGMIAATVGSAVGLGNVWRFPAEVQANGGAAFLLIYIVCVFLLGIPVMTAEFALGRGGHSDASGAYLNVTPRQPGWALIGLLGIVASYLILSFYMVVSGWTLGYFWESVSGGLYSAAGVDESGLRHHFQTMVSGTWQPIVLTVVMIALNGGVLLGGVKKGIERMSNFMMPLLFVLLLVFCIVALNLDGATQGLEFFLKPDFGAITGATVVNALGQAFFSLSLAMGILVTYASYFPADVRLTRTAVTVSMLDLGVALLMGMIIFPAVMTFGLADADLAGSSLVFVTLPEIFAQMSWSSFWSALFFMLLTVAAFTSTISLAEVSVAFVEKRFSQSRQRAVAWVLAPLLVLSPLCSLSVGGCDWLVIGGRSLFDFLDTVTTNLMLPAGGIMLCIYVGWVAPRRFFASELTNQGTNKSRALNVVYFIVRWIAPVLITTILVSQLAKW